MRTLLWGLLAIGGAAWALVRHYTHVLPPLRVPITPSASPLDEPDSGELPAPEIETLDVRSYFDSAPLQSASPERPPIRLLGASPGRRDAGAAPR
ncbi:MAG: hypothetical protein ABSC94_01015 [Polyangiaceae bacterium]|jgi:hypothetical protein